MPCFTLRDNTERPVTIDEGTNTLVMADARGLAAAFEAVRRDGVRRGPLPRLWDGRGGERSAAAIAALAGRWSETGATARVRHGREPPPIEQERRAEQERRMQRPIDL